MSKLVSVIVPCFNEEKYIANCIYSLLNNGIDHEQLDIIIIDGGSSDKSVSIINAYIENFSCIRLFHNEKTITPVSLNIGVKNATAEYFLIASAHASFENGYIQECLNAIEKYKADVIGGVIETTTLTQNKLTNSIVAVLSHAMGVGNSMFRLGTRNVIEVDTVPYGLYKREVFEEVGFYNEKLVRNQDIEFSKRLKRHGKKIVLIPGISCKYFARENLKDIAKNNYLNGFWNIKTVLITRSLLSLSLRHFIPLFFLLSLISPILISIFYVNYFIIMIPLFILTLYLLLVFISSLKVYDRQKSFFYILFTFVFIHFSYGFGSIMGFLKK